MYSTKICLDMPTKKAMSVILTARCLVTTDVVYLGTHAGLLGVRSQSINQFAAIIAKSKKSTLQS